MAESAYILKVESSKFSEEQTWSVRESGVKIKTLGLSSWMGGAETGKAGEVLGTWFISFAPVR